MKLIALATFTFAISIILTNFFILALNENYYFTLFEKEGVYSQVPQKSAKKATNNLIGYLWGQNKLDDKFYSKQAVLHMTDVKNIFYGLFTLGIISLITFVLTLVILQKQKMEIKITLLTGCLLSILITLFIGLFFYFNFQSSFLYMHYILFSNDLWLFPPSDNLIKLFPQAFFADFAKQLAIDIISTSVLVFIAVKLFIQFHES